MSLDKDRILNDLGNVMSQLQSADCGCMGKLFSNHSLASQGMGKGYPLPTCGGCRRGCCRGHGHPMTPRQYSPCAGEPCSMNNPGIYQSGMRQPAMPFLDHTGTYQTGMDQTGMEQSEMGQAEMGQPGMGYHGMGQPDMGQPGMGQPGMGQPGMGLPGMGLPGMGLPGMGQPGMGQPGIGQAGMGQRGMPMKQSMHPAMGSMGAHAPKLYADTYNYLSKNLMNPIVQEVYQDLKSITPENTMTNSPIGAQMGLKPGKTDMTQPAQHGGNTGMPQMGHGGGMNMANMGNPGSMNQMGGNPQQMGMDPMGMGPQIAKMMMGDGKSNKLTNPIPVDSSYGQQQESTPSGDMANPGSMGMGQGNPGSMGTGQGNLGSTGMGQGNIGSMGMGQGKPGSMGMGQGNPGSMGMGQNNPGSIGMGQEKPATMGMGQGNQGSPMGNNMGQGNSGSQMQDPNTMQANYMTQQSMNQPQHQTMAGGKQQNGMVTNPMQQMAMGNKDYGEHTEGMKKFNEMFPGVTGVGGDLGFDPMAIAFQMNPANHKQSAMNSMNKMLMGDRNKWMNAANNHLQASFSQLEHQKQPTPQQQQQSPSQAQTNAQGQQQMQQQQDQQGQLLSAPPTQQLGTPVPQQQQQVYSATGAPVVDQLYNNQGYGTSANRLPTQPGQPGQAMYKEHLLPADSSRNMAPPPSHHQHKHYHYNPLGQPVEMLPAQMFRTAQETGPQTLSPQPIPLKRTVPANVKNTESKTSIMSIIDGKGTGFNPSKMQHIYNQYKGSQSYSPSNVLPTRQSEAISEGHLTQINNLQNQRNAQPGNVSGGHLPQMQNQRNASPERLSGGHRYQIQNQRNIQPGSHSAGHITQNQWNAQPGSHSAGHITQNQWNAQPGSLSQGHLSPMQNQRNAQSPIRQANVEQVGGDASANNNMAPTKVEQVMGQIGDVPAGEPMDNTAPPPDDEMMALWENKNGLQNQMAVRKNRNGLQDQVYTAGPITNAWSFTGRHRTHRPAIPQYRSVRAVNW